MSLSFEILIWSELWKEGNFRSSYTVTKAKCCRSVWYMWERSGLPCSVNLHSARGWSQGNQPHLLFKFILLACMRNTVPRSSWQRCFFSSGQHYKNELCPLTKHLRVESTAGRIFVALNTDQVDGLGISNIQRVLPSSKMFIFPLCYSYCYES